MLVGAFGASAFGLRGGVPMEAAQTSLYRAAFDSNTYNPLTCQEAGGIDSSFKGLRVRSACEGEETGGKPVSRKETTLLSMRELEPYPRLAKAPHGAFAAIS